MRTAAALLAFALSLPVAAPAHARVIIGECRIRPPARLAERHHGDERFAIHTPGREATMLLTRRVVAVQLDERVLHQLDRETRRDIEDENDCGFLGQVVARVAVSAVRAVIAHSVECPIRDLRDVRYHDGRLEVIARNGRRIFEHFEVNGGELLDSFTPADAMAFVEQFHRIRGD